MKELNKTDTVRRTKLKKVIGLNSPCKLSWFLFAVNIVLVTDWKESERRYDIRSGGRKERDRERVERSKERKER